jgi:hypothetical protein
MKEKRKHSLRTRLEEDSRAVQDEDELSDDVDAWLYKAYVSLHGRSADIQRSSAVPKVTLGPAILRGSHVCRQLVLPRGPRPLYRQAAASKIRTAMMKPLSPLALRKRLPYKTPMNFSPMVRKRCRNGLHDGDRAISFGIELPMHFLVPVRVL